MVVTKQYRGVFVAYDDKAEGCRFWDTTRELALLWYYILSGYSWQSDTHAKSLGQITFDKRLSSNDQTIKKQKSLSHLYRRLCDQSSAGFSCSITRSHVTYSTIWLFVKNKFAVYYRVGVAFLKRRVIWYWKSQLWNQEKVVLAIKLVRNGTNEYIIETHLLH